MKPVRIFTFEAANKTWVGLVIHGEAGNVTLDLEMDDSIKAQIRTLVEGWDTDELAEASGQ